MGLWDRFKYDLISPGNARGAVEILKKQPCLYCGNRLNARFFSCDYEKVEGSERELRKDWWFQGYAVCTKCAVNYITQVENDPMEFSKGYYWNPTRVSWTLEKVHEAYQIYLSEEITKLNEFYEVRQKLDPRQPKVVLKILKYHEL